MSSYVIHAFPVPFIVTETGTDEYIYESVIVCETFTAVVRHFLSLMGVGQ